MSGTAIYSFSNMFNFHKEKGLTIIELIIIITLIAILPAIVISDFGKIKKRFALSRVAYKFAQDVRHAQDMALASKPYIDGLGQSQPVAGYGIYLSLTSPVLGKKKYITYADRADGFNFDKKYMLSDYTISTVDFSVDEPGIIIKETTNPFGSELSINFTPPKPITTITELPFCQTPPCEGTIDVIFAIESDITETKTVSINTSGLIEVK